MTKEELSVKKGDVIMVRFNRSDNHEDLQSTGKAIAKAFPNNKIIGVLDNFDVSVIHKAVPKFSGRMSAPALLARALSRSALERAKESSSERAISRDAVAIDKAACRRRYEYPAGVS